MTTVSDIDFGHDDDDWWLHEDSIWEPRFKTPIHPMAMPLFTSFKSSLAVEFKLKNKLDIYFKKKRESRKQNVFITDLWARHQNPK